MSGKRIVKRANDGRGAAKARGRRVRPQAETQRSPAAGSSEAASRRGESARQIAKTYASITQRFQGCARAHVIAEFQARVVVVHLQPTKIQITFAGTGVLSATSSLLA